MNSYQITQTEPELFIVQLSTVNGWLNVSPHYYELQQAVDYIAYMRKREVFLPIVYDEFGVAVPPPSSN